MTGALGSLIVIGFRTRNLVSMIAALGFPKVSMAAMVLASKPQYRGIES
jgi:hypothetical protein